MTGFKRFEQFEQLHWNSRSIIECKWKFVVPESFLKLAHILSKEYISYSGDENRSGCCWSNEHQKPINTTQSTSTNGIFATECGVTPDTKINDQNITPNCWSKRCQESINRIQSTDTNPVNILATACGRNDCDYLNVSQTLSQIRDPRFSCRIRNIHEFILSWESIYQQISNYHHIVEFLLNRLSLQVSHKLDKTNLSKSNPIDDNICNDNNYPNGSVSLSSFIPQITFSELIKLFEPLTSFVFFTF